MSSRQISTHLNIHVSTWDMQLLWYSSHNKNTQKKSQQIIIINNKFNFFSFLLLVMLDTRWNINTFSTSFPLPSSACNVDRILTQVGIIFFKPSHMNNMRVGECLIPFIEIFAWFGRVVCREREKSFWFSLGLFALYISEFYGIFLVVF